MTWKLCGRFDYLLDAHGVPLGQIAHEGSRFVATAFRCSDKRSKHDSYFEAREAVEKAVSVRQEEELQVC